MSAAVISLSAARKAKATRIKPPATRPKIPPTLLELLSQPDPLGLANDPAKQRRILALIDSIKGSIAEQRAAQTGLVAQNLTQPTRRGLLTQASAAAALAAVPIAGGATPAHPDADLFAVCAEFERLEAAFQATGGTDQDMVYPDGYDEAIWAVWNTPAVTLEGMQAKARAIVIYSDQRPLEFRDSQDRMIWSLVEDVAGRAVE